MWLASTAANGWGGLAPLTPYALLCCSALIAGIQPNPSMQDSCLSVIQHRQGFPPTACTAPPPLPRTRPRSCCRLSFTSVRISLSMWSVTHCSRKAELGWERGGERDVQLRMASQHGKLEGKQERPCAAARIKAAGESCHPPQHTPLGEMPECRRHCTVLRHSRRRVGVVCS